MDLNVNKKSFLKKVFGYSLKGLLIMAPFYLSLSLLSTVVVKIDHLFKTSIPGFGLVVLFLSSAAIGYLTSTLLLQSVVRGTEDLIKKLPFLDMIYSSSKEILENFSKGKKIFDSPVFVKLSESDDVFKMGFVMSKDLAHMGMSGMVSVYIPNSYSFSGEIIVVPDSYVKPINASTGDVTKFILSGGITEVKEYADTTSS